MNQEIVNETGFFANFLLSLLPWVQFLIIIAIVVYSIQFIRGIKRELIEIRKSMKEIASTITKINKDS